MFGFLKRTHIANKAKQKTVKKFKQLGIAMSFWHGALWIPPYSIGLWIFFRTDAAFERYLADGTTREITEFYWATLKELGYPDEFIHQSGVAFGSKETVDRDYQGNYYYYVK